MQISGRYRNSTDSRRPDPMRCWSNIIAVNAPVGEIVIVTEDSSAGSKVGRLVRRGELVTEDVACGGRHWLVVVVGA